MKLAPGLSSYKQVIAFYGHPKLNKASIQLGSTVTVTEKDLFMRSGNSQEIHGVPSAAYSLGFTAFDDTINKYYHQPSDDTLNFDWAYIERFYEGFAIFLLTLSKTPEPNEFKQDKQPFFEAYQNLYTK